MALRLMPGAQLNWLARYLPLRRYLTEEALTSMLDVGSGPVGLACITDRPFVGCDVAFPMLPAPGMVALQHAGGAVLPFFDQTFHTVVCLDVLEHVSAGERRQFLAEVCRISSVQVLVACPVGPVGVAADALVCRTLEAMRTPIPPWAREHEELGLPSPEDLEAIIQAVPGFTAQRLPTPGGLVAALVALADMLPGVSEYVGKLLTSDPEPIGRWFDAGDFGPPLRVFHRLARDCPAKPALERVDPASLARVLRCTKCGAGHLESAGVLCCTACGLAIARVGGVWRADRPEAARSAAAPVTFSLRPDWRSPTSWLPVVHAYLTAFPPEAPCRLALRLDAGMSCETALAVLAPVLEPWGARPFPELLLEDGSEPVSMGLRIELASEQLEIWTASRLRAVALKRRV